MNDAVELPGVDRLGVMDRRYDVRIAARLEGVLAKLAELEDRIAALEP